MCLMGKDPVEPPGTGSHSFVLGFLPLVLTPGWNGGVIRWVDRVGGWSGVIRWL